MLKAVQGTRRVGWRGDSLGCKPSLFAAGLCCSDAGRGSLIMLTLVQDVPVLSPVLQKGAYWRQTCPVLFDVQLTRILTLGT